MYSFIVCLDTDTTMGADADLCQRCSGIGCYMCEATKICDGCKISLRVGCFDAGELCKTCARRKKYVKRTALNNAVQEIALPVSEIDVDLDAYVTRNSDSITETIEEAVNCDKAVKVYVTLDAELARESETGMQHNTGRFQTPVQLIGGGLHDLDIGEFRCNLHDLLDRFTNLGSGFTLLRILKFVLHIAKYRPLVGSAFIPTPEALIGKRAIVNPQNYDNECFKWAVLASLYPADNHTCRVSNYKPFENKVDWSTLKFPVGLKQIREFESVN